MKKLLCMLLTMSIMLTMLAACNSKPVEDVENSDDNQAGEETIVSETLDIVVDGVSEYVIVRGENASPAEITAASELQAYLKQISGAEIAVVTDSVEAVEKEIVVGKTNRESVGEFDREELGDDGLVIKTVGEKLFLVGGEKRGTLYAVYEFLESYLGCRFYTREVEKIPDLKTVSIEKIEEDKQIPVVMFREFGWLDYNRADFCVKRKLNSSWAASMGEEWGGEEPWVGGHSMSMLVNVNEYYDSHPEYFAMQSNGKRANSAGFDSPQVCLSNPEVIDILIENVRNWVKSSPNTRIFHIGQNDNQDYCVCDECVKIYNEEGGALSGTMIRAVNAVATALADEFPDILFQTYAYQYTRSAPKTKPADNVMIMLCNIEKCASHKVDSECLGASLTTFIDGSCKTFAEDLDDWRAICDKVYIYEYHMNWGDYHCTLPDFHNLYYDTQYYVNHNAVGILSQGKTQGYCMEFGELRTYLLSKLFWNPYMTEEEYWALMDEFLKDVYGPGWVYLKEYLELAETVTEDHCFGYSAEVTEYYPLEAVEVNDRNSYPAEITADMLLNYENVDWTRYWNWFKTVKESPITAQGSELFAKAVEMAETESQKRQLDKISTQIELLYSYYLYEVYSAGSGAVGKIITNFYNANPDAVEKSQRAELRKNIIAFASAQGSASYENYSKMLVEKMQKYGQYYREQGPLSSADSFIYKNSPRDWLD